MKSPHKGIKRIINAFGYSKDGFVETFKSESAFRQDILFCLIFGFGLFLLPIYGLERAYMIFSLTFILVMELVNSAIEVIIDRVGEEYHTLSKKAKDIGSLLVLISFINFFLSLFIILFSKG